MLRLRPYGIGLESVVVRHDRGLVVAVAVEHELEEVRPVQVGGVAVRPRARSARQLVEGEVGAAQRGHAQVRVEQRVAGPPRRRPLRLLVRGQPLDHPARLDLVGRPHLAHHAVDQGGQAAYRVEVHDVRVLVRGQVVEPVVVVAEGGAVGRRRREHGDDVARHHAGEAVRAVGVVPHDDVGLSRRCVAQRGAQRRVGALGRQRHLARHVAQRLVVVHLEVLGLDGAPHQRRISGASRVRSGQEKRGRQRERGARAHRAGGWHGHSGRL